KFHGTGVAMVTPFNADGSVDYNGLKNLINYLIEGKVEYLVSLGTTGEASTLNKEDKKKIWEFTAEINNGRLPLVAGIGGNDTASIVKDVRNFESLGYDAILSASPYYNKPTQEGVYQHYKAISEGSSVPIILYNVPGRTGSNVSPETTCRLANDLKNVIATKEASGSFDQFNQIMRDKPDDFLLISGDDPIAMPMISLGAVGVISVIGNALPKPLSDMINTAVTDYIENESGLLSHIDKRIIDEAKKLRPTLITIGERKPVEILGRTHVAFERALKKCVRYKQTFIAGPAGTGKTTLASQIAKALELPYGHISCTAGMSEAHLLGRMDAHGNYLPSEFVNIYENGGVFLFDEIDAADSNTLLIINSALANGHMSVPNRKEKPFAKRHENFYCIAAANTWGFGSNEYAGRNVLDAATLDRFTGSQLFVDYDIELEKEISKHFPQVAEAIQKIRENVKANRMRRVVSTRAVINGVIALTDGDTLKQYISDFLIAWTEEERKKALLNVSF
ncbi:MAG: 4-hydroxy-tetrahydrodipicolinate synthase, partial [Chitinophagaceae bacterium]